MSRRRSAQTTAIFHRRIDRFGRVAYGPTAQTAKGATRFVAFQRLVLAVTDGCSDGGRLAAHLLAFDLVVTEDDLRAALQGAHNAYRWRSHVCVDWERGNDWRDRRAVSGMTCVALAQTAYPIDVAAALAGLAELARRAVPRWADLSDEATRAHLFDAAQSWAVLHLPGFLAAHVLRDIPLQVLPRTALVREAVGRALAAELPPEGAPIRLALFDGVVSMEGGFDATVVEVLRRACREAHQRYREHSRARGWLLRELERVSHTAVCAGWVSALLYLWVWDLVESGTERVPQLAPVTIVNYTGPVLLPLAEILAAMSGIDPSGEVWQDAYLKILSASSQGNLANVASGLSAFHAFLRRWFDVEPLPIALHEAFDEGPPNANMIWPHEIERVFAWLDVKQGDERMRAGLIVAFRLAWATRLRTTELLTLRLRNVVGGAGEIEVAPLRRDGKTKSDSSVRLTAIDAQARAVLDAWIERRREEGAGDDDLVWGDPHAPRRVYRAGSMRFALSRILQCATGDPSVTFHTLSHRWVNEQIANLDEIVGTADLNPLDVMSAGAGHFSAATLRHYAHVVEFWLRREIDTELQAERCLTSDIAARYTGEPAARLRKRASRAGVSTDRIGWAAIDALRDDFRWPDVATLAPTAPPVPPAWIGATNRVTAAGVANVIEDLVAGTPERVVALRSGCSVRWVREIASAALSMLRLIGAAGHSRRVATITGESACIELRAWGKHPKRFNLASRHQRKYDPICARLPADREAPGWVAWAESYRDGYLALTRRDAGALLSWLSQSGVPVRELAVSMVSDADGTVVDAQRAIEGAFRTAYGIAPLVLSHIPRQGRPEIYLVWSSALIGSLPPKSATLSLDGLHAWMLAAGVAAELNVVSAESGESHE